MAVKNSTSKNYSFPMETIMEALRNPQLSAIIDASLMLEGKNPEGIIFRYERRSTMSRYGRNYEVLLTPGEGNTTDVKVTIQSRKVTVLIDPAWEAEAKRVYSGLELLLSKDEKEEKISCKACGAPIGKEDKFCKECGAKNE